MNIRQGVQDIKYLEKLREIAGGREDVQSFLKEAAHKVVVTEAHDHTTPDRMREEAAALILKYGNVE